MEGLAPLEFTDTENPFIANVLQDIQADSVKLVSDTFM